MSDRVFEPYVLERTTRPNESPIVNSETVRDEETGSEMDLTFHADGSITIVAIRILKP